MHTHYNILMNRVLLTRSKEYNFLKINLQLTIKKKSKHTSFTHA